MKRFAWLLFIFCFSFSLGWPLSFLVFRWCHPPKEISILGESKFHTHFFEDKSTVVVELNDRGYWVCFDTHESDEIYCGRLKLFKRWYQYEK